MHRYRIIISRDRPDLLGTLAVLYGQKGEVEILFDRRHGQPWPGRGDRPDRRRDPQREQVLRERGFLVIPRQTSSGRRAELTESAAPHARRALRRSRCGSAQRFDLASVTDTRRDCL